MESLFVEVDGPCCIPPTYPTAYSPESTGSAQPLRCARGVTGNTKRRHTSNSSELCAQHCNSHLRVYITQSILSCRGRDRPISLCARVRLLVFVLVVKVLAVEEEVGLVSPSPGTSRHLPHRGSRHKLMSGAKNESALRDVLDRPEAYLVKEDERGRCRVKTHSVSNPHRAELQGDHK